MHRWAVVVLLVGLACGCAGGDPDAAAMLEELCADPALFEGETVRLSGPLVLDESTDGCTAAACGDACCNACTYPYVVACPDGSPLEALELWGSDELGTPVIDAADWGSVSLSPGDSVMTLGCVGDSCGPRDCTPVEASRILWVEGTVTGGTRPAVMVTDLEWE